MIRLCHFKSGVNIYSNQRFLEIIRVKNKSDKDVTKAGKQHICFSFFYSFSSNDNKIMWWVCFLPSSNPPAASLPSSSTCQETKAGSPSCHPLLLQHNAATSSWIVLLTPSICPPTRASYLQVYQHSSRIHISHFCCFC